MPPAARCSTELADALPRRQPAAAPAGRGGVHDIFRARPARRRLRHHAVRASRRAALGRPGRQRRAPGTGRGRPGDRGTPRRTRLAGDARAGQPRVRRRDARHAPADRLLPHAAGRAQCRPARRIRPGLRGVTLRALDPAGRGTDPCLSRTAVRGGRVQPLRRRRHRQRARRAGGVGRHAQAARPHPGLARTAAGGVRARTHLRAPARPDAGHRLGDRTDQAIRCAVRHHRAAARGAPGCSSRNLRQRRLSLGRRPEACVAAAGQARALLGPAAVTGTHLPAARLPDVGPARKGSARPEHHRGAGAGHAGAGGQRAAVHRDGGRRRDRPSVP